jgi:hypothetical protein
MKTITTNLNRIEKLAAYLAADYNDRDGMAVAFDDDREVAEKILTEVAKIKRFYKL